MEQGRSVAEQSVANDVGLLVAHAADDLEDLNDVGGLVAPLDGGVGAPALLLVGGEQRPHEAVSRVTGAHLAPGRVGLDEQALERQRSHHVEAGVGLHAAAVDAQAEAHGQQLVGLVERPVEGVHDPVTLGRQLLVIATENRDEIVVRRSTMEIERQLQLYCQLDLPLEELLLDFARTEMLTVTRR